MDEYVQAQLILAVSSHLYLLSLLIGIGSECGHERSPKRGHILREDLPWKGRDPALRAAEGLLYRCNSGQAKEQPQFEHW